MADDMRWEPGSPSSRMDTAPRAALSERIRNHVEELVGRRADWTTTVHLEATTQAIATALSSHGVCGVAAVDGPGSTPAHRDSGSLVWLEECQSRSPLRVAAGAGPAVLVLVEAGGTPGFQNDVLRVTDSTHTLSVDFCRPELEAASPAPEPGQWILCLGYAVWQGARVGGRGRPASWLEVESWVVIATSTTLRRPPGPPDGRTAIRVSQVTAWFTEAARSRRTVDVVGEVSAISPVFPMKAVCFFLVELAERVAGGTNAVTTVVFKKAMHLHCRLELKQRVLLTFLTPTTLFPDRPTLCRTLLRASSRTTVVPCRSDTALMPPLPQSLLSPPTRSAAAAKDPQHTQESKRRRVESKSATPPPQPSIECQPEMVHRPSCGRVVPSYSGTVTRVVHPDGLLYELDESVLLLCSHWHTVSRGRQLRVGNRVRIHNAHVVHTAVQPPHLGALGCCLRTSIDLIACGSSGGLALLSDEASLLLLEVSKNMTLARFLAFLPTCTAIATKFGGNDTSTIHKLLDALRKDMRYPRMAQSRNMYTEFYDHGSSCVISCDPTLSEVKEKHRPLAAAACSKIPQVAELGSKAALALLAEPDDLWGKSVLCHFDHSESPGVLVGVLVGTRSGELEICDCPSNVKPGDTQHRLAVLVEGIEPHHLGLPWLFLHYRLCTERLPAPKDVDRPPTIRTSVMTRVHPEKFRPLECSMLPPTDLGMESDGCSMPVPSRFRDVCFLVTEKRVVAADPTSVSLSVSGALVYGVSVAAEPGEDGEGGPELAVSDELHTTEHVTLIFTGTAAQWYPTIRAGRAYYLRRATLVTLDVGSSVHVTATVSGCGTVCTIGLHAESQPAELQRWATAFYTAEPNTEAYHRVLWLERASVLRLASVIGGLLGHSRFKYDALGAALGPTVRRGDRRGGSTVSLHGIVIGRSVGTFDGGNPTTLTLHLEDAKSPDTATLYMDIDRYIVPLGLVVGVGLKIRNVERCMSKVSGSYYFRVLPCTELTVITRVGDRSEPRPLAEQGAYVPCRSLHYYYFPTGRADRALGKLWCTVTTVWKITCSWTCTQCGNEAKHGVCHGACDSSWHTFETYARFEIQDGTARADIGVSDPLALWELLGVSGADVAKLQRACRAHGEAVFSQGIPTHATHDADVILRDLAVRRVVRYLALVVRPAQQKDIKEMPRTILQRHTTRMSSKPWFELKAVHVLTVLERARQLLQLS
jgi:hypothetical protein